MSEASTRIDRIAMLRRVDGDPEILRSLITIFFDTYPAQLDQLETALATGQLEVAERIAHSLKGSLQVFFKGDLPVMAYEVEDAARKGDSALASQRLQSLSKSFESAASCLAELREYLE